MKNYSMEQQNYLTTKKEYEAILNKIEIEKELSGVDKLVTDGKRTPENKIIFDKKMDMIAKIEFKFGKWEALKKLSKAEDKMIEWSFEKVKVVEQYEEQKEEIEHLKANYKKYPKIKEKLVNTAIKLTLTKSA